MKQTKIVLGSLIFFIAIALIISCRRDRALQYNGTFFNLCDKDTCYNNGVCYNGLCKCPVGYEGTQCKQVWNERYVGDYDVADNCKPDSNYVVSITPVIGERTKFLINGLSKYCSIAPTVTVDIETISSYVVIHKQRICGDIYLTGTGNQTVDKKFINLALTARDSIAKTTKECSLILKRK